MPCVLENYSNSESFHDDNDPEIKQSVDEAVILQEENVQVVRLHSDNDALSDHQSENKVIGESPEMKREISVSKLTNSGSEDVEDYEQIRNRNIKEKEKMLSEIFKDVNMEEYKHQIKTPRRKQINQKRSTPKTLVLPRKHLPRRSASKVASERLAVECFSDDDDAVNLSDEEEVLENGKRRKVIVAYRPRTKRLSVHSTEPPLILSADEITDIHLKNVAEILTQKVYSQSGTTCHQCRQKTIDMKTICRSEKCTGVRGYFCGPCLRNRYGEDAREALKNPHWECPPCRDICNCSICRNRAGASATGILAPIAKRCGYASVKDYLNDHDKYIIKYEDD